MKLFSIPADFKKTTIDQLYELNEKYKGNSKVIEMYGQSTDGSIVNSGRGYGLIPKINFAELKSLVAYSQSKGIDFNYTLNPACLGNKEFTKKGIKELKDLLKQIRDCGITHLTVASPSIMELVNSMELGFKIKTSAICEICEPSKALFYKNLNVERVVVDPDITRKFTQLENICEVYGSGVEIIINNVCYKNCPYKMFHYNQEAHQCNLNGDMISDFYYNRCSLQKADKTHNFIRLNWIRPEDLKFYEACGIHNFKIQGRQNVVKGDIIRMLEAYINESFDGNLNDLIMIFAPYDSFSPYIDNKKLDGYVKTFYEKRNFCSDICNKCGFCLSYAKKSMDVEKTEEANQFYKKFFGQYDKYNKWIRE